jgi:hypothetical protein
MESFPEGKRFAFSIFDDTDSSTLESVGPVYRLLAELNLLITKSVWVFPTDTKLKYAGSTLRDCEYQRFILDLKQRGFEIGLHNVQNGSATRDCIVQGLDEFRDRVGDYPRVHANHLFNRDNLYWGAERLTHTVPRLLYNAATRLRYRDFYQGQNPASEFFWGDIAQERITYVRNLTFEEINLARLNPSMPYHDPAKPYVNYWFSSSDGGDADHFCRLLSEANQDRLEAEGGFSIVYTHFACGFVEQGVLHPEFERLMKRLASKNGWFVPVSTLLEHLRRRKTEAANGAIPSQELASLERRWIAYKLRTGPS